MEWISAGKKQLPVSRGFGTEQEDASDWLAIEEPLEIRLGFGPEGRRKRESLAVTMRTPGNDFDLAMGFLFTEGIIGKKEDVVQFRFLGGEGEHVVLAELHPTVMLDMERFKRHFYAGSSCGVCGKSSLESIHCHSSFLLRPDFPRVPLSMLTSLPEMLRPVQTLFSQTGGVHAAALFDVGGKLLCVREDVGRHNALDKLIGAMMKKDEFPLDDTLLLVSGRAGFEIVQKALMAGISVLAAVGAPSSLAVELAESAQMTLVGFLRGQACNIYSGKSRIVTG